MRAVQADSGKSPGKDTPKIILLVSMLSVCLVLCLVVCAYLVLKRGAEPSGSARATRADTQSRHDAERSSESVEEPAEIIQTSHPADEASPDFNSYVDSGYEYYTSFQQILSYDCGGLRCSVNYDTGSGIVHFISFYGTNVEDHAELIQELAALASPEYTLSAEALRENILSTEDVLLHLEPPDMWHEEYVYQDACISLSMTCSDGTYDLQVTSRKYADDTAQNTLSISRPK